MRRRLTAAAASLAVVSVASASAPASASSVDTTCGASEAHLLDLEHITSEHLDANSTKPWNVVFKDAGKTDGNCFLMEVRAEPLDPSLESDTGSAPAPSRPKSVESAELGGVGGGSAGVFEIRERSRLDLTARFLECSSRMPIRLPKLNVSLYALNAPATRQMTVRGYWSYSLNNKMLFQKMYTDYGTTFVDSVPCTSPVGSPACALSFFFQDVSEVSMTLETIGPSSPFYISASTCSSGDLGDASGCAGLSCPTGFSLRDHLAKDCPGEVCSEDECCERMPGVCADDICGSGYILKPAGDLPAKCDQQVCSQSECCELPLFAGDNAALAAAGSNKVPSLAIASCHGHERQWVECDGLPECNVCVPQDCEFTDWTEWIGAGGCSGLCKRARSASKNNECGRPCNGHTEETVFRHDDPECYPAHCKVRPVDCLWNEWNEWSECQEGCSVCMLGQSHRQRHIKVKESGGGKACSGPWNMTRPCQQSDAIDCQMSEWNTWSSCSRSCGTGSRFRTRRVLSEAQWGGKPCGADGDGLPIHESDACNTQVCEKPVDCILDIWADWQGCDESNKYQKFRSRDLLMPAVGEGAQCSFPLSETRACPQKLPPPAPKACDLSEWTEWSACTATCQGQRERTRHITNPETCVLDAVERGRSIRETAACGVQKCWEDKCELSDWSAWSQCSAECGIGVANRSRTIVAVGHTKGCTAPLSETQACKEKSCEALDCAWDDWEGWSECTCSCGGGTKRRRRSIKVTPRYGGRACDPEAKDEVAPCNTDTCNPCIDAIWGTWSVWSKCSSECAPAFRTRHRDLSQEATACGKPALGDQDEFEMCDSLPACDPDQDCKVSDWTAWSPCSNDCFGISERRRDVLDYAAGDGAKCANVSLKEVSPCNPGLEADVPEGCGPDPALACHIGEWEEWSSCSKPCGLGQQTRHRHVLSPAANDGKPCKEPLAEIAPCNSDPCNAEKCQDCLWGPWSEWGECSKCGSQRYRVRSIETLPDQCGQKCNPGAAKEVGNCTSECEEKLFCAWSAWVTTTDCSADCGYSARTRQRHLSLSKNGDEAKSLFVGTPKSPCSGAQLSVEECPFHECKPKCLPVDCVFNDWEPWGECSCNQLRERNRTVHTESSCGGQPCNGALLETEACEKECVHPVDCKLGDWEEWTPSICGSGGDQRFRTRKVAQEPANGGSACSGVINETIPCGDDIPSPVDCVLEEWKDWSLCSARCGGGFMTRSRKIKQASLHGGEPCVGNLESVDVCNTEPCDTSRVDCKLSEWIGWSSCNGGLDMRFRLRTIAQQPEGLGTACQGPLKETEACSRITDCEVSEWTAWDDCDKTCGGGQQTRTREVIRNPSNGGEQCPDQLMETQGCNEVACASKDCTVGDWTAWSECSESCGAGFTNRSRSFTSRPCEDGHGCSQHLQEVKPCDDLPRCECNDCLWGDWKEWSTCSSPCDGGQRSRQRHIVRVPDPGCAPCEAKEKEEIEGCNTQRCHEKVCVDGAWDEWKDWEPCSASCQGGQTWRVRGVKVEANDCGSPATGLAMEYKACNGEVSCEASVDCEFDEWSGWSSCSARCAGLKRRRRGIKTHGRGEGAFCEGPLENTEPCQISSGVQDWLEPSMYLDLSRLSSGLAYPGSEPALFRYASVAEVHSMSVDLVVVPKNTYTGCSLESNGVQGKGFGALNVASGSSVTLAFRLVDSSTWAAVNAKQLTIKVFDLDAGLAGASEESVHARNFLEFSLSANSGIKVEKELSNLTRFKASAYGTDDDDPEDPKDTTAAQEAKAVSLYFEETSEVTLAFEVGVGSFCKTFLFAARACLEGDCKANPCKKEEHEPVDCQLGEWSSWGTCDATCGVGQRVRSRKVLAEPAYGGRPCNDALSQTGRCSQQECERCTPIDCAWEEWGAWSKCDQCDGQMHRYRHITVQASCGGKACDPGDSMQLTNCTRSCREKVFCEWAEWQPFGACSATCGSGLRSRTRYLEALSAAPEPKARAAGLVQVSDAIEGGAVGAGAADLEAKFEQLSVRSERLRTARFQVLALSFAAGCFSLVSLAACGSRSLRRRRAEQLHGARYGHARERDV